jgi:hypothetical protein
MPTVLASCVRSSLALLFAALAAGCGDENEGVPRACGLAGQATGVECAGLEQCGGGASNFRAVTFCSLCPRRPETHVCEAGVCKALGEGGSLTVNFTVPTALRGAAAFTLTSFGPIAADGTRLTCAALLSTCTLLDDATLPVGNSNHLRFSSGPADPTLAYIANHFDYVGADRLLLLQVTSEAQGNGRVIGRGCAEGLTVQANASTPVTVEVAPL